MKKIYSVLKKFGIGNEFQKWIQTLMENLESCFASGGKTTLYFKFERGTRQGDPISSLEVVFSLIKVNSKIEGLQFFSHTLLYSAYADDTTFFL